MYTVAILIYRLELQVWFSLEITGHEVDAVREDGGGPHAQGQQQVLLGVHTQEHHRDAALPQVVEEALLDHDVRRVALAYPDQDL